MFHSLNGRIWVLNSFSFVLKKCVITFKNRCKNIHLTDANSEFKNLTSCDMIIPAQNWATELGHKTEQKN